MSETTFRWFLRDRFIYTRLALLEELKKLVSEEYFRNNEWLSEMDSLAVSVRLAMIDDKSIFPVDLGPSINHDGSLVEAQSYIMMYGVMMLHWEDIADAATEYKAELCAAFPNSTGRGGVC